MLSGQMVKYNLNTYLRESKNEEPVNKHNKWDGAIGINFHQLSKPTNLQNSVVLKMLKTEEDSGLKKITWPPPPEDLYFYENQPNKFDVKQYNQPSEDQPSFKLPPAIITLRPELPISQESARVYQAQPAAVMAPTSGTMRGDMKWPPESVRQLAEAENMARSELAKGPAFRPRLPKKDYTQFFAQNALNSNYPGYRAPPGTQYFTPHYHQTQHH